MYITLESLTLSRKSQVDSPGLCGTLVVMAEEKEILGKGKGA